MLATQFWYYRRGIRTLPEGTGASTKIVKFFGFLALNAAFGTFYTNFFALTPL
jgi:hypothetical protein